MQYRLRFTRLTGTNVCSYRKFDIDLTNRGTVLLTGVNGSGKCVVDDTVMPSEQGLVPIGSLIDTTKPEGFHPRSIRVATAKGTEETQQSYHQTVDKTVRVTTRIGLSQQATHEHPLLCIGPEGVAFRRMDEIKVGDYVAVSRGSDLWSDQDANLSAFRAATGHGNRFQAHFHPKQMTSDLAWVCGALLANGRFDERHFSFCSGRNKLIQRYCDNMQHLFGVQPSLRVREGVTYATLGSLYVLEFLEFIGFNCARSAEKCVPNTILRSTRDCVLAFLEGYLETDSGSDVGFLYLSSASQSVIRTLQLVFLNLGAVGRIDSLQRTTQRGETPYWALTFDGDATQAVLALFPNYHKRNNLRIGKTNPNLDTIPFVNQWLARARTEIECRPSGVVRFPDGKFRPAQTLVDRSSARRDRSVSHRVFRREAPAVIETYCALGHPVAEQLQTVLDTNYYWDRVVSTDEIRGPAVVCDFRVREDNPTFVAGGFVNHNSTPWYALCHLLYYFTPKGLKYRDLICVHHPRDYWCRVEFEIDGVAHAIEEFRDHSIQGSKRIIWRAGQDITPTYDNQIRAYIPDVMGLDQQSFLSNVFLSQEHTHILIDGKPKERQDHIMWLFGLHSYDQLGTAAKQERDAMSKLVGDIDRIVAELEDIDAVLKELPTRVYARREIKRLRGDVKGLNTEIEVLEGRRSRVSDQLSKIEIRDELVSELRELAAEGTPTPTQLATQQREIRDVHEKLVTYRSERKIALKVQALRDELERYQDLPPTKQLRSELEVVREKRLMAQEVTLPEAQKAHRIRGKINKIRRDEVSQLEALEDQEGELQRKTSRLSRKIKDIKHQLKQGVCPTCKRPWELTAKDLRALEEDLADVRGQLDDTNQRYYAIHARAEDARQLVQLRKTLDGLPDADPQDVDLEVATLSRQEKALRGDLTIAEERESIKAQLTDAPKRSAEDLRALIRKIEKKLYKLRHAHERDTKAHDLLRRISKMPTGSIDDLKGRLIGVEDSLKEAREKLVANRERLSELNHQLEQVETLDHKREQLEDARRQSDRARRDADLWEHLRRGFQFLLQAREAKLLRRIDKELPMFMNPLFGDQASWVRTELCKEGKGKRGLDMQVMSKDKLLPPKGPSPGQNAKLGIAMLFALRELYARNQCNLLILDEPLWRIDEEARPAFIEILDSLRDKVETLVLTTHEAEVKGHTFDHRWRAEIRDGISTLTT